MKKIMAGLIGLMFILCATACSRTSINAQSQGGDSVEAALTQYAQAWANIDYNTYTGQEILPYMTKEWGKKWYDSISPQYIGVYKQQKIVRVFDRVDISDVAIDGDTASAVITVYSTQKKPNEKACMDLPVTVSLAQIDGKWFINGTEQK